MKIQHKINAIPLNIWFYDFEVFKNFWCVTFYNLKTHELVTIKNNFQHLKDFYNNKLSGFLTGYNNVRFDDYLLKETLQNNRPNRITDWIINQKKQGWEWEPTKYSKLKVWTFDTMDLIGANRISLKMYEAFLGLAIKESDIPFDYDQELDEHQKAEIISYNIYDVKSTAYLFCKFIDQFFIKLKLIDDYKLDKNLIAKTDSQITAKILNANKNLLPRYQQYNFKCNARIRQLFKMYAPKWEWIINKFESVTYKTKYDSNYQDEQISFSVKLRDLTCDFKSGGLHAAIENYLSEQSEHLIMVDIVQNYGNLIVNYDLGSRAAPNMKLKLKSFMDARAESKKTGDSIKADYLKILTVRPFGSMDYQYNDLWDPLMRQSICISGQLIIFLLAILIEPYGKIIQINTDGVLFSLFKKENLDKINRIFNGWEKITQMKLDQSTYSKVFQKDVNNYILIDKPNDNANWKAKGAGVKYFKEQFHRWDFNKVRGAVNNNLTVLDECVVNYFTKNIPVKDTLLSVKELIRFQFVFEVKGNYTTLFYGEKELKHRKVWRAFYTKTGKPLFKSYKLDTGEWKKDKVPRSSEFCKLVNGDIRKATTDDIDLDYEYYEILANDIISLYKDKKETVKNFSVYTGENYECDFCSTSLLDEKVVRKIYEKEVCKNCYTKKENKSWV